MFLKVILSKALSDTNHELWSVILDCIEWLHWKGIKRLEAWKPDCKDWLLSTFLWKWRLAIGQKLNICKSTFSFLFNYDVIDGSLIYHLDVENKAKKDNLSRLIYTKAKSTMSGFGCSVVENSQPLPKKSSASLFSLIESFFLRVWSESLLLQFWLLLFVHFGIYM